KQVFDSNKATALQRTHALWALERLGALDDARLKRAAADSDRAVRIHAMRVIEERGLQAAASQDNSAARSGLKPALRSVALTGLGDSDALVRRCAAEALGARPSFENLRALLNLRARIPAADTHLLYVV